MKSKLSILLLGIAGWFASQPANACTGITLKSKDGTTIVARTIEWGGSNLNSQYVIVPRGYTAQSYTPEGINGMKFTARYGYVGLAVEQKEFIAEGVNEAGLSAGLFYFPSYGKYEDYNASEKENTISDLQLVSWILGNCATLDEVKEAVRWQIKDALGFPVEDASLDVFTVPGAPGRPGQLYAVAANNSALRPLMLAFAEAKLDLAVVDIPEMAQRNLAILCEKPGRGVAFFSLSDEGGLLTFSGGGDLYASRRIEVSLASLRQADGERRAQLYERVVLEIQRTLDTFDRQFGHLPIDRLYLGPLPGAEELQKELAESVYVPVENFALSNVMDLSLQPDLLRPEVQASALLAIGAALRPFSS